MLKKVLSGGIAGLIATAPMTAVMAALHTRLPAQQRHPLPPEHIVGSMRAKLGLGPRGDAYRAQVGLAHFGYGAGMGSVYFTLVAPWTAKLPMRGALFGVLVWAVSYFGLIPGMGLLPSAEHDSRQRNALMIAAHIVWGTTLQLCEHLFLRRRADNDRLSRDVTTETYRVTVTHQH